MVVMDQFSRRIIGFAVHSGHCDGITYCRMFNEIISGQRLPKYLSSDNDPLFLFHRWKANLRVLEIEEIKSVPRNPNSHPFIERIIGSTRRECLKHILFFNSRDLQNKLNNYKIYYNETRGHSSLDRKAPLKVSTNKIVYDALVPLNNYHWKSHCNGLYKLPIAA